MRSVTKARCGVLALTAFSCCFFLVIVCAAQAGAPIKETLSGFFGREVDLTTGANYCLSKGQDKCGPGKENAAAGGFTFPKGVAGAPNGNIYVSDNSNRVQEFDATGAFVSTFGNTGSAGGQFNTPTSIAVDSTSGEVYVEDHHNWRVEKFSATGEFVLAFGKEVDKTTHGDICTAASNHLCGPGVEGGETRDKEGGIFHFLQGYGNLLAVGGPEHLVYVGDEHRVQEYEADGKYKTEIPLTDISPGPESYVTAIAVDDAGDVFLVYRTGIESGLDVIHKFLPTGTEVKSTAYPITVVPTEPGGQLEIGAMALDDEGRLAVTEAENFYTGEQSARNTQGTLYDMTNGSVLTHFSSPDSRSDAFNGADELFAVAEVDASRGRGHEVWGYGPLPVAELISLPQDCVPGIEHATDVTLDCVLHGDVNPWGVGETVAWFEWGRTATLGEKTPSEEIASGTSPVEVQALVEARPNESSFYYRLAGTDGNAQLPEILTSPVTSFTTPIVAPWIDVPSAKFVRASSMVLAGVLNPENGDAKYGFEYMPLACPVLAETPSVEELEKRKEVWAASAKATPSLESSAYGKTGIAQEVNGLQADTLYCYRLHVETSNTEGNEHITSGSAEVNVKTALAATPRAQTGIATAIGEATATLVGAVDPDGQSGTYRFEVGIYKGDYTQYGVVSSGSAGSGSVFVPVSLLLSGLQPGTTYAYRVSIQSAYVTSDDREAVGQTSAFTTIAGPQIFGEELPGALPLPKIRFPHVAKSCRSGYKLDKKGRCVRAKAKRLGKKGKKGKRGHKASSRAGKGKARRSRV
jgi:hypothetical protein